MNSTLSSIILTHFSGDTILTNKSNLDCLENLPCNKNIMTTTVACSAIVVVVHGPGELGGRLEDRIGSLQPKECAGRTGGDGGN